MTVLWIALGSALGGVARYALSGAVARLVGETFPWGTVVVNVTGCFAIGFLAALTDPEGRVYFGSTARQFVLTGVLGGYTTFSSFSLQTWNLLRDGEVGAACANVAGSVFLCLAAVWLGHALAASLNAMKGA